MPFSKQNLFVKCTTWLYLFDNVIIGDNRKNDDFSNAFNSGFETVIE